mgnify:CR=1 FL=1
MHHKFSAYTQALAGLPMPQAFVDMEALDANLHALMKRANGMPIRLASKSLRSPQLMRYLLQQHPGFQGLLCFHAQEAVCLAKEGFQDLLVAYPTLDPYAIREVCQSLREGAQITLMVDHKTQVRAIQEVAATEQVVVPLCMDVDMSMALPGLHFGVQRSPIRSVEEALALYAFMVEQPNVRLEGVMGYEAQIAGVVDNKPGQGLKNQLIRALKKRSIGQLQQRRKQVVKALEAQGATLRFVNGGGTGSIESTREDTSVTEVAAGSGIYSPALFDYYLGFQHEPALYFALEVCRQSQPQVATCLGGGYVASGAAGEDKLPVPVWPPGLSLLPHEGAGEVQTPVTGKQVPKVGEKVFFRHAKAGELAERFNELVLIRHGQCVGAAQTYRGLGWQFI